MNNMNSQHFVRSPGERPEFSLTTLALFARVCETGSMTAAAAATGTTQSAASRRIQQLERDLGVPLLERDARPLRASPAGEVLLEHATGILAAAARARVQVLASADSPLPRLRLGLVDSFAVTLGPELIKALQRTVEDVRVWSGLSRQLADGLLAHELDLLVTADPLDEFADLRVTRIFREPFLLALPGGDTTLADESLETLTDTLPMVRYSLRSVTGRQVERYLRSRRLAPPRRMEFDGSESVIAMVQEGLGWALTTPLCLLQARADLSRLALRALPAGAPRRGLFLVSRAGHAEPSFEAVTPVVQRLLRRLTRTRLRARVPGAGQIEVG